MKRQIGFTLPEALAAMSILAILVAMTVPNFQNALNRNKVRKTSDLILKAINMAQNEALRRNMRIYLQALNGNICIGTTAGACDIQSEPLLTGIEVSNTRLQLSPFYGIPNPAPAAFIVSYSGLSQTVSINRLGVISIGEIT